MQMAAEHKTRSDIFRVYKTLRGALGIVYGEQEEDAHTSEKWRRDEMKKDLVSCG